jgi:hypothetical protein
MTIPPEIVAGLDHYRVAASLRDLVGRVAAVRSVTADSPGVGYVAVRPAAWGTVSAYFHTEYVDVALSPDKARLVEDTRGWKLLKVNSETGFIRIRAEVLAEPETMDFAASLLLAAVDKSETGTAYEGGRAHKQAATVVRATCPTCQMELPATGHCDWCS